MFETPAILTHTNLKPFICCVLKIYSFVRPFTVLSSLCKIFGLIICDLILYGHKFGFEDRVTDVAPVPDHCSSSSFSVFASRNV